MPAPSLRDPRDKNLGAYYTESRVAEALCRWAMRGTRGRLLDPAFGGGVFLEAAASRGATLGAWELCGVEVEPAAHGEAVARGRAIGRPTGSSAGADFTTQRLILADFFSLSATSLSSKGSQLFDAVVGNPPFIRFQRFAGEARALAAVRANEAGMILPPLAGSWVAFVAHATTFLRPGGRLAMVVPAELGHSPYARPLLELLHEAFARCTFVTFRHSLFPHLDQETVLLLADGFGDGAGRFTSLELEGPGALDRALPCSGSSPLDPGGLIGGKTSLAHARLEPAALELYEKLGCRDPGRHGRRQAVRLGELALVASGYVTGANSHFHLTPQEAQAAGLPREALVPAVFRSRALTGLRFDLSDWQVAGVAGWAGYLVQAAGQENDPAVAHFLERLRAAGVDRRYKTSSRSPWYRVGRVAVPPLILAGMGGQTLPLVVNENQVAVPNTFHAVAPLTGVPLGQAGNAGLTTAWLTSLASLSVELEGHRLGGGMLKLDPGEALNVLLPSPGLVPKGFFERLESLFRAGDMDSARNEADQVLLVDGLGLTTEEISLLQCGAERLRSRRQRLRPAWQ
ncbi:MAG: N-6 DNA methylase [Trueperaceae bacterium]